jgi:pimeloyl-ACP methyl ester carboxylesterase
VVVALAGCGAPGPAAPGPAPALTSAPAPASTGIAGRCGPPDTSATAVSIPSTGATLAGYEVGRGGRGVVLIPERGGLNICGWWPYAAYLAGRGFHVLLFDQRCAGESSCPATPHPNDLMDDLTAVTGRLRQDGALRIVLIGASQGGAEAVIFGARPPVGVAGVVALSADELTDDLAAAPYPASASAAASRLRLPALFVVAADDPYVSVVDSQKLESAVRPGPARLDVVAAGRGHGWDMLTPSPDGSHLAPDQDIRTFLSGILP